MNFPRSLIINQYLKYSDVKREVYVIRLYATMFLPVTADAIVQPTPTIYLRLKECQEKSNYLKQQSSGRPIFSNKHISDHTLHLRFPPETLLPLRHDKITSDKTHS